MTYSNQKILNQLSPVVSVIPKQYVDALLALHGKLEGKPINWVVCGDLSQWLHTLQVELDSIDIFCSKQDAYRILEAVEIFHPKPIRQQTQKLSRNAVVNGQEYSVFTESHFFEFLINGIGVRVFGDLRFKVNGWGWGDVLEFDPEYVYVVGKKTAVMPLAFAAELYQSLGWTDRAEKIRQATALPKHILSTRRWLKQEFYQQ